MIFLTGSTGYIGSYVATNLLRQTNERLALLVRADDRAHAERRLWKAWQLHMSFEEFLPLVRERVEVVLGDLTTDNLGLSAARWQEVSEQITSVLHIAASLNRKSAKACFNVNLRGTLSIVRLARDAQDHHGLRRFSDVSTVAVSGHRSHELVPEDQMVEWDRSDYDPYARTKKFCEHMLDELLPDVDVRVYRPATVLGDTRMGDTTQFDMVRAFVMLANMPVLPLAADWRMDIVPVDYVAKAITSLHQAEGLKYKSYNLASGAASQSYGTIVDAMAAQSGRRRPVFAPRLEGTFTRTMNSLAGAPRGWPVTYPASLMKVFMPYLANDTVFDNYRVVEHLGETPTPFSEYAWPLFDFATRHSFKYPYVDWPQGVE